MNKCKYIVNLQGAEAYCVATRTACLLVGLRDLLPVVFTRATHASAVFAVLRCPSVGLSVCLSVTLVDCIHTGEDVVKLLVRPGSPIISFSTPCANTQFQWEPLQQSTWRVGKVCDFRLK